MSEIRPEIRDHNLRLTLADQEGDFIRRKVITCRRTVWMRIVFLIAAIVITAGLAVIWVSSAPAAPASTTLSAGAMASAR